MEAQFSVPDHRVVLTSSILRRISLEGYGLYAATIGGYDLKWEE